MLRKSMARCMSTILATTKTCARASSTAAKLPKPTTTISWLAYCRCDDAEETRGQLTLSDLQKNCARQGPRLPFLQRPLSRNRPGQMGKRRLCDYRPAERSGNRRLHLLQ